MTEGNEINIQVPTQQKDKTYNPLDKDAQIVLDTYLSTLTELDFMSIRGFFDDDDDSPSTSIRKFVDERSHHSSGVDTNIEQFKDQLREVYIPFLNSRFNEYRSLNIDFFVIDGTSAVGYSYLFKSAFRTYANLHPDTQVKIPEFLFLDVNPLRKQRDKQTPKELTKLLAQPLDSLEPMYDPEGIQKIKECIKAMQAIPNPSIVVFDEYSDPKVNLSSLHMAEMLITQNVQDASILADSPKLYDRTGIVLRGYNEFPSNLLSSYSPYSPIRRTGDGTSVFRRPSPKEHPVAHEKGLEYIRECKKLGELVAQTA